MEYDNIMITSYQLYVLILKKFFDCYISCCIFIIMISIV